MRFVWSFGLGVALLAGGGVLYAHRHAPPSCRDQDTINRVSDILHAQFHLGGIFLNDVRTISNGFFGSRYKCSAEVAEIAGNVNASSMPWRAVSYTILSRGRDEEPAVTVALGGAVPLAAPNDSFWAKLMAHFGG